MLEAGMELRRAFAVGRTACNEHRPEVIRRRVRLLGGGLRTNAAKQPLRVSGRSLKSAPVTHESNAKLHDGPLTTAVGR